MLSAHVLDSMPRKMHHRCNLCGRDFDTGDSLRDHVSRRHPRGEEEVRWWMVVEDPDVLPFEH